MKKAIIILCLGLFTLPLAAQNSNQTTIVMQEATSSVAFQASAIQIDSVSEIEIIEKTSAITLEGGDPDFTGHTGRFSIGVALGGGGLAGGVFRFNPHRMIALEAGVFYRPAFVQTTTSSYYGESNSVSLNHGVMLATGVSGYMSEKYKSYKGKLIRNGMMAKVGIRPSAVLKESMYVIGWSRQTMKTKNKRYNFNFELGVGVIIQDLYTKNSGYQNYSGSRSIEPTRSIVPLIYWKCHWGWFVG